jgi:hypothetical protein
MDGRLCEPQSLFGQDSSEEKNINIPIFDYKIIYPFLFLDCKFRYTFKMVVLNRKGSS